MKSREKNFLMLLCAVPLIAQQNVPILHHDIAVFAGGTRLDKGKVTISVEVLFDDLQFVKNDSGFQAQYELSAVVYRGKEQVDGESWKQTVRTASYDRTNSRDEIDLSSISFELEPSEYRTTISFQDLSSGQTASVNDKFRVENFGRSPLTLSDIVFARQVDLKDGRIDRLVPQVTNPYKGLGRPSFAYFEVYSSHPDAQAEVNYRITGEKSRQSLNRKLMLPLSGERSAMVITLPIDSLQYDAFRLEVEVLCKGKKAEGRKVFYVRWPGLPRNARDLNLAIEQLQLVASQDEWRRLKKAAKENRAEAFAEFWAVRDPSPGTDYNEAMEAYYQRVNYANNTFSVMGREGWRTDRGLVFIILGPPDEVIRNDYPSNSKPYQIWQYYTINRQFQFYDRSGYGDYELLNPISLYELQRFVRW